jgi:hypothetical protein
MIRSSPSIFERLRPAALSGGLTFCVTCGYTVECPPTPSYLPQQAEYRGLDYSSYTTYQEWGQIVHYTARLDGLELRLYVQYLDGYEYEENAPLHELELVFQRLPPLAGCTRSLEDSGDGRDSGLETGVPE